MSAPPPPLDPAVLALAEIIGRQLAREALDAAAARESHSASASTEHREGVTGRAPTGRRPT